MFLHAGRISRRTDALLKTVWVALAAGTAVLFSFTLLGITVFAAGIVLGLVAMVNK